MPSERADLQKAACGMVRVLTEASEVVHAMRSLDCVAPMLRAMRAAPSMAALLLPSLTNMAAAAEVVEKAYEAKLVPYVLELLGGALERCDDPSAVKAHAVRRRRATRTRHAHPSIRHARAMMMLYIRSDPQSVGPITLR